MKHALTFAILAVAASACGSPETKSTSQAAMVSTAAVTPPPAARSDCAKPPGDLVIKDIEPGTGDTARFRSAVLVNYKGWLYDGCAADFKGALFDESTTMPLSVMVGVGRVIRGWDEGLVGMKEGGKRILIIPPEKGYGSQGAPGGKIPPNSTLVFEVNLAKIIAQPQ